MASRDLAGYVLAALGAGLIAGVAVLSVRAQDPALAGVGLAAAVGVLAIVTVESRFGIGAIDPAWTLVLLIRRRIGAADLLPIWAAQAIGAVTFGLLARWLVDDLRPWSVIEEPDVVPAAIVLALVAFVGGWTAQAIDAGRAPAIAAGLPTLGAGAALAPTFAAAANPAALFALGVAGVAEWEYVFFTAVAAFGGAVLGAITTPMLAPVAAGR